MIEYVKASLVAAAIAGVSAFGVPAHAATHVTASQKTCAAFAAWQRHQTTANLDRLVTVSLGLPHGYLASDVAQLLSESVTAKPKAKYIASSARYVAEDCAKS